MPRASYEEAARQQLQGIEPYLKQVAEDPLPTPILEINMTTILVMALQAQALATLEVAHQIAKLREDRDTIASMQMRLDMLERPLRGDGK